MPNRRDPVLSALSLATKAGAAKSGEFQTENAVKQGKAVLVLVAEDSSAATKKQMTSMCEFYEVPIAFYGDRESLGRCIGKDFRSSIAITDEKLAALVEKGLKNTEVAE